MIVSKIFTLFKIKLFSFLFSDNEKCLLNQSLNLGKQELMKDYCNGFSCQSDFKNDMKDIDILQKMCENKLWH